MRDGVRLSATAPVTLPHVRIARFVTPSPAAGTGVANIQWGVVEGSAGAALSALTVAAIADHPFGPIAFTGDRWALPDVRLLSPILPSKVVAVGKQLRRPRAGDGRRCAAQGADASSSSRRRP